MKQLTEADDDPPAIKLDPMKDEPKTLTDARIMIRDLRSVISNAPKTPPAAKPATPPPAGAIVKAETPTADRVGAFRESVKRPELSRAEFDSLTMEERNTFIRGGGRVIE